MRGQLVLFAALFAWLAAAGCQAPESSPLEMFSGGPRGFELRLEGNVTFDTDTLVRQARENLQEFVDRGFKKYAVDDAAYAIQLYYEGEGFAAVEVDYELVSAGRERPLVRLIVTEGPRTELFELRFEGNVEFAASSLRQLVLPSSGRLFGPSRTWYSRARVEAGRSRIQGLYYERGFLDVRVEHDEPELSEDATRATVTYRIAEGPQYVLREVELFGVPEDWLAAAQKACAAALQKPWFPRVGFELEAQVEEVAAERGHPYAHATAARTLDPATGDVRLELTLDPGPEVHIGELRVVGNEKTSAGFILSRVELGEGQRYDRSLQRESFRNLYETGLFQRVTLRLEGEEEGRRDLVVEVQEGPTLEVYAEPGYGSYELFRLLAGVTERNLFGTGRRLTAEATVAVRAQNGLLRFTEPNVFGPRTNLDLELFAGRREEPSFTRVESGGAAQLRHRISRRVSTTLRYERSTAQAQDVQAEDPAEVAAEQDVDLSLISFTPAYDSRNAPFLPTSGTLGRVQIQLSDPLIASELGYVRLVGTFAQYFRLGAEQVIAASVRTGVLLATDGTETFPIQLRFFNGGESTVRSFKESQLGPKDATGEPLGGEVYNVFSMEYRRMLVSRLQGALFFDAGNVLSESGDYGSFDDIRMAVGVGVRWILPIGPVRLDWGINPDRRADEDSWVLHFSLGTAY